MKIYTCVQCGEELEIFTKECEMSFCSKHINYVCKNSNCPNFGLVAMPREKMIKEEEE